MMIRQYKFVARTVAETSNVMTRKVIARVTPLTYKGSVRFEIRSGSEIVHLPEHDLDINAAAPT
jgi:hypothetical protein